MAETEKRKRAKDHQSKCALFRDRREIYPELKDTDREGMKRVLEDLADRYLAGEQMLQPSEHQEKMST